MSLLVSAVDFRAKVEQQGDHLRTIPAHGDVQDWNALLVVTPGQFGRRLEEFLDAIRLSQNDRRRNIDRHAMGVQNVDDRLMSRILALNKFETGAGADARGG